MLNIHIIFRILEIFPNPKFVNVLVASQFSAHSIFCATKIGGDFENVLFVGNHFSGEKKIDVMLNIHVILRILNPNPQIFYFFLFGV